MAGKLIVIDGIDGSGKKTQTKFLVQKLLEQKKKVESIDFPQDQNFFGKMVRQYLKGEFGKPTEIHPLLASLIYAADRWESVQKINQWLKKEKIVIVDRYYTSNLIHQSTKIKESKLDEFIHWVHKMEIDTFKIPKPAIIIFLHVKAEISLELIKKRGKGNDGHENLEHLKLAENRSVYMAKKLNWQLVECCENNKLLSIEEIKEKIINILFKKNII